jgi:hypothetical protein
LLGAQGALGWYMVQSGLEPANFAADGAVPHVSQYRFCGPPRHRARALREHVLCHALCQGRLALHAR